MKEALYPAALLGAACAVYASFQKGVGTGGWFLCFYKAFAAMAPAYTPLEVSAAVFPYDPV